MGSKQAKILDGCLARTTRGEPVDSCLADYPEMREQLEPLLRTAIAIAAMPKAEPSDIFRETARDRLMARLRQEARPAKPVPPEEKASFFDTLAAAWRQVTKTMAGARRIAVPVTLALVIIVIASLGATDFMSPAPALASRCTLSIFSGDVEVQNPEDKTLQPGSDGMTLGAGTHIKTGPGARALLTFFDGSTLSLDPNTDLEIQQLESDNEKTTIILKQWAGRTWSRVVKMMDAGSQYQIETPSACAIVRGTLFATEVDEAGTTQVATTQGLVSVAAQGEEVFLPPNVQTRVEDGMKPSPPAASPAPDAMLVISIDAPAIASIIDPNGLSTGCLPGGESFNQIPGSQSVISEGTQQIAVPYPQSGEYKLVLRYLSEGTAGFNIQGISGGTVAFDYSDNYDGSGNQGGIVSLELNVADGLIVSGELGDIASLGSKMPEKVVEKALIKDPTTPPGSSNQNAGKQASDNDDQSQNNSQSNAGGNSGNTNDNSNAGGDSGNSDGNSGNSHNNAGGDSGNSGGNSGNSRSNAGGDSGNSGGNSGNSHSNAGGDRGNSDGNSGNSHSNAGDDRGNSDGNSSNSHSNAGGDSGNSDGNSGNSHSNAGDDRGNSDGNSGNDKGNKDKDKNKN